MKPELIVLAKFFGVSCIGGLIGLLAAFNVQAFALYFIYVSLIQFLVGILMKHHEKVKTLEYLYQQRLDEGAILAANTIDVACAACQTRHSIPIIITQRNLFSCRKCEVENVIMVNAETALTTKTQNDDKRPE